MPTSGSELRAAQCFHRESFSLIHTWTRLLQRVIMILLTHTRTHIWTYPFYPSFFTQHITVSHKLSQNPTVSPHFHPYTLCILMTWMRAEETLLFALGPCVVLFNCQYLTTADYCHSCCFYLWKDLEPERETDTHRIQN